MCALVRRQFADVQEKTLRQREDRGHTSGSLELSWIDDVRNDLDGAASRTANLCRDGLANRNDGTRAFEGGTLGAQVPAHVGDQRPRRRCWHAQPPGQAACHRANTACRAGLSAAQARRPETHWPVVAHCHSHALIAACGQAPERGQGMLRVNHRVRAQSAHGTRKGSRRGQAFAAADV